MIDKTPANSKIAKTFFIDYRTISDVSQELYGKKRIGFVSNYFKTWNDLKYLDDKHITIDKKSSKGKEFTQAFTGYRLNLNPYFEYIKSKLKMPKKQKLKRVGWLWERANEEMKKEPEFKKDMEDLLNELGEKELNKTEKEIINYIFSFKEVREIVCRNDKLMEGITAFLERIFFYKTELDWPHNLSHFFRKGFFIKNKSYFKVTEEIYIDLKKCLNLKEYLLQFLKN